MKKATLLQLASLISIMALSFLRCSNADRSAYFSIVTDESPGAPVMHGLTKLTDALNSKNISFEKVASINEAKGNVIISAGLSSGDGETAQIVESLKLEVPDVPEALTIRKTRWQQKSVWVISGFDDVGLMYGLLDVALYIERNNNIRNLMSAVKEITEKPDVTERAISIYTMNRAYWESRFYDEAYWERYFDMLSKNRFNSVVVIFGYENGGFLAPCYPYFFNTEGFSHVQMVGITPQEQERNLNALNNMIRMAHDMGIRFSVGIRDHIYRGGVQGGGIPGTKTAPEEPVYGLVWGVTGDNLITYTKTSLQMFVKLVPDIVMG